MHKASWKPTLLSGTFRTLVIIAVFILIMRYNLSSIYLEMGPALVENTTDDNELPPKGFLVWNDHCRIPNVDPFSNDTMKYFHRHSYKNCSNDLPLTKITYDINNRSYILDIDQLAKQKLLDVDDGVKCCYQTVLRSGSGSRTDFEFKLTNCTPFHEGYVLPSHVDGIIITCKSMKNNTDIQKDAYYFVQEKPEVRKRLSSFEHFNHTNRPISVLMFGIDSMSRFNLRRAMPETAKLLNDSWFELSGYNKVADNTLPNLIALLTGYSLTTAYAKCSLPQVGGLDDCNLIWQLFRQNGYATAYAEDETWLGTFAYSVQGFRKPPVDYYHKPFMMAIEKSLEKQRLDGLTFCIGLRHSAEYVYDLALDFATRYNGEPYFGLFWTNTFSHNSFDSASAMDSRVARYIKQLRDRGILNESIVMIFSDHGMRFGPLLRLENGYLQSRVPFFFIWLPPWFRAKHPEFAKALTVNRYRLTNPYDIHMTLKHILELSGRTESLPKATDCPNCQSLFVPVPAQRSCKDISIDDFWCSCESFTKMKKLTKKVFDAAEAVANYFNTKLKTAGLMPPCLVIANFTVQKAWTKEGSDKEIYRIKLIKNYSQTVFVEASVSFPGQSDRSDGLVENVIRLDEYKNTATCIDVNSAKMFCICK